MDDFEIFQKAVSILRAGEKIALVTVISTTGSTPGKVGYKMLVTAKSGETHGTVGGGMVEAEMIKAATSMLPAVGSRVVLVNIGVTPDDEENGICGGSIEFLIESFDAASAALFEEIGGAIGRGEDGTVISAIEQAGPPRKIFLKNIDDCFAADSGLAPEIISAARDIAVGEQPAKKVSGGGIKVFIETVARRPAVIIFGAGHLSFYIARFAKLVNLAVKVCDDREEFAKKERFPDANEIIVANFENVFERVRVDGNSYLVIVTRGHKCDEVVLEKALRTEAKYIGMIGSRRKVIIILQRLREKGISREALSRIYSPMGISIGAVTPEEIALSTVCELVKIRRLGPGAAIGHMTESRSEAVYGKDL
jgi:xanthine dehydrogenase accessory factor